MCSVSSSEPRKLTKRQIASGKAPNHHLREWARALTNKAVRHGWLVRPELCEHCKQPEPKGRRISAHHKDYARPFDIAWLCHGCHTGLHAIMRSRGISGEKIRTAEEPLGWKAPRSCSECRSPDHYRNQCPAWLAKHPPLFPRRAR